MFLATTAITEFWNKNQKILFLGPWCLSYTQREEWSKLNFHVMDNPWDDREKFYKAYCYTDKIYEQLLRYLTEFLNTVHKTNHSERYWRILIGPWLLRYIYALYDRYCHLQSAFRDYSNLETWRLSSECFITPQNIIHFKDLYLDDLYNLQLFSQILSFMGYNFPDFPYHPSKESNSKIHKDTLETKEITKDRIKHFYSIIINRVAKRKKIILSDLHIPKKAVWKIMYASGFQAWPIEKQWEENWPGLMHLDIKTRTRLVDFPAKDNFLRILVQSLPKNFPKLYIEGYHKSRQQVLQEWKRFPRIIMSSVGWEFNEYFKFFSAEASKKHTRLLAYQHGGGYGSGKIPVEKEEVKISDTFYSWGWTSAEYLNKIKPLPNPRLSNQLPKDKLSNLATNKNILFLGTNFPRYTYYFFSVPVSSQFNDYLNMRMEFVRSISPEYRSFLLFRLYHYDHGWYESDRLKEEYPNLRFDDHRLSFTNQLSKARIAVIDHPMSAFLEALSFNFPCLLFWNPNYWEIRDEAAPFFERLQQAGILFYAPEAAADKIMDVYDNPLRWWLSTEVQSARAEFVKRFALGSKYWLKAWINELRSWNSEKAPR